MTPKWATMKAMFIVLMAVSPSTLAQTNPAPQSVLSGDCTSSSSNEICKRVAVGEGMENPHQEKFTLPAHLPETLDLMHQMLKLHEDDIERLVETIDIQQQQIEALQKRVKYLETGEN